MRFDVSARACDAWGFYHGDVVEYTADDLAGTRGVILGFLDGRLWRYDETSPPSPAAPFLGRNRKEVETLHVIRKVVAIEATDTYVADELRLLRRRLRPTHD